MSHHLVGAELAAEFKKVAIEWANRRRRVGRRVVANGYQKPDLEWLTDFVSLVDSGLAKKPGASGLGLDMGIRFGAFMDMEVSLSSGRAKKIRDLFRSLMAPQIAEGVVRSATEAFRATAEEQARHKVFLSESGAKSLAWLEERMLAADAQAKVIDLVMDAVECDLRNRDLRSLFEVRPDDSGFRAWGPGVWSDWGEPMADRKVRTDLGEVVLKLAKYDVEEGPVAAYEWMGQIKSDASSEHPDAVAVGMLYKFPRGKGRQRWSLSDFLVAADSVADTDILQVSAFLNQHEDAETVIQGSDLCFVWIWERREGAPTGSGRTCLVESMQALRRLFPRTKTLVVNVRAEQFVHCVQFGEPVDLAAARLEAIDSLLEYAGGAASAAGMEFKPIVNRHQGSVNEEILAMQALVNPAWLR